MFEESKDNEDKYIEKDKDKKNSHDGKSFKVVDKRLFSKDGMTGEDQETKTNAKESAGTSESERNNIHEEKNIESENTRTELHDNVRSFSDNNAFEESETIGVKEKSEFSASDNNDNNLDELKADFSTFIYSLNAQALFYLGKLPNPMTGKYEKDLKTARYLVDTIDMLFNKTKGNLDANESKLITNILYDLKMFYVNEK